MSLTLFRRVVVLLALLFLFVAAAASAEPRAQRALPSRTTAPAAGEPSAPVSIASGTTQRTFVSAGSGNDANPCTRTAPCRNFAAAIAQTSPGGEVIVLDSGGYGPVTIGSAISLVAPRGVYAGITAFTGNAITVGAGASDVVTLRGLTITGLGGSSGVVLDSVGTLNLEGLTIAASPTTVSTRTRPPDRPSSASPTPTSRRPGTTASSSVRPRRAPPSRRRSRTRASRPASTASRRGTSRR